ncbi:MAG: DUF494 family protein [Nitrososphaerales archaeon]
MKEKVIEILVYIMSEVQENKRLSDIDLGDLKSQGYTQSEISAAFSWLYDTMRITDGMVTRVTKPVLGSRRVLNEAEKLVFSTESQGYLIQLRELGLLDDQDVESVIERAMVTAYEKLSVDELREIVASVLFSKTGRNAGTNHSMLNSRDTIH